ncbi:MAG TPA: transcription antitermination factor NusB [Firmicutes bacterium]|nr:transcription antitermination factor NusB [Bacillota bacterium]
MRKYAREVVFSLTFEYLFTGQKNELGLDMFEKKKLTGDDIAYIGDTYNGIIAEFDGLQSAVASITRGYKLERIYKVDLAILIYAMYELSKGEIPTEICVNEAVELAKKFSTDKSDGFVNGVLAEYVKNKG